MFKLLCGLCQQLQRDQQQRFPRRKISEEPQLPFSPYSDTFAHRVHSNRVGEQVFTEANPYVTGPEPPVHPNLRQQSFQSREDTVGIYVVIPQVNPSKRAFEQGNQQVQQNSLTSPYQGVSGSQTNFVAPPIPGQQVGIMHSGQAVQTYQAGPGSPGMVYQVHPNQVMAQPPFPPSGPNVQPNVPQNFVAGPVQQQTHLYTQIPLIICFSGVSHCLQPQPGQQPQYSAIPGVPSGPFPNVPQSGGAQGVPAYAMPNPMAMYSMNPGGMGMAMQPSGMGMPMSGGGVGMPFSNPSEFTQRSQKQKIFAIFCLWHCPSSYFRLSFDDLQILYNQLLLPHHRLVNTPAPASPALTSQPVNTAPQVSQAAQPLSTLPQAPVPAAVAIPTPVVSDVAAPIAVVPVQTGSGSGAGPSQVQVQSGTPTITAPATVVASGTSAAVQGSAASGTLPSGPASSPVHPSEGATAAASPAGVGPVASNPVQGQQSHAAVISPDPASHPGTVASEGSKMAVNASTSNIQQTTESPTSSTTEYEYEDGTTTSATTTTTIRITTAPPPTHNPMLAISELVKAEFGRNNSNSVNQGADAGGSHGVGAAPVFIYFLPKNVTSATGTTVNPPSQIVSALVNVLSAAAIKRSSDAVMATPLPVMATPPGVLVSDVYKSHRSPSSSETASTSVSGSESNTMAALATLSLCLVVALTSSPITATFLPPFPPIPPIGLHGPLHGPLNGPLHGPLHGPLIPFPVPPFWNPPLLPLMEHQAFLGKHLLFPNIPFPWVPPHGDPIILPPLPLPKVPHPIIPYPHPRVQVSGGLPTITGIDGDVNVRGPIISGVISNIDGDVNVKGRGYGYPPTFKGPSSLPAVVKNIDGDVNLRGSALPRFIGNIDGDVTLGGSGIGGLDNGNGYKDNGNGYGDNGNGYRDNGNGYRDNGNGNGYRDNGNGYRDNGNGAWATCTEGSVKDLQLFLLLSLRKLMMFV
ncbi:hypothetical protein C0Q70_08241 [Pomacea canaliculata]|uniref:Uncharacterized protein n=1 Tax=Pomacea canaliculata TaxID=400727 RepID=A0A2T7PH96_POMCA|nr:hypothetical protein C0Q70_08241 [Pomacea canaliculata]